jgi:hypothetical protein
MCGIEMEYGTLSGDPHFYIDRIEIGPREIYHVRGYRCPTCGYLQLKAESKSE